MRKKRENIFVIEAIHYATGSPVRIEINNGIIECIKEITELTDEESNLFVAPGLIDNQINGYSNVDFSGNNLTAPDIIIAAKAIRNDGVTSFLPALISNSHENLIKNLRILSDALETDEKLSESIPGFHLEGPYISPEDGYRGCHPAKYVRKPFWNEFIEYKKASGGKIIQVTIAPEVEGAIEFIRLCSNDGIVTAMGHTNASAEQISLAMGSVYQHISGMVVPILSIAIIIQSGRSWQMITLLHQLLPMDIIFFLMKYMCFIR